MYEQMKTCGEFVREAIAAERERCSEILEKAVEAAAKTARRFERERCAAQAKRLLSGIGIDNIAEEVSDRIRKGE